MTKRRMTEEKEQDRFESYDKSWCVFVVFMHLLIFASHSFQLWAHGVGAGSSHANVGKQFAIRAYNPERGFQLSAAAEKRLLFRWQSLAKNNEYELPAQAVAMIERQSVVFRKRRNWIAPVPVDVILRKAQRVLVRSQYLQGGDAVVVQNSALLRVVQMDLALDMAEVIAHERQAGHRHHENGHEQTHEHENKDQSDHRDQHNAHEQPKHKHNTIKLTGQGDE